MFLGMGMIFEDFEFFDFLKIFFGHRKKCQIIIKNSSKYSSYSSGSIKIEIYMKICCLNHGLKSRKVPGKYVLWLKHFFIRILVPMFMLTSRTNDFSLVFISKTWFWINKCWYFTGFIRVGEKNVAVALFCWIAWKRRTEK